MVKMSENVRFQPKPKQIKFAEIYLDINKKLTQKEIANDIKINVRTIERWLDNNNFVNWLNSKKNEILKKSLIPRYKTAIRKAAAGDFQFSKMLFEMTGDYTQKMETKVINVFEEYANKSDEEIINEFEFELNDFRASKMDRKNDTAKKT